MTRYFVEQRARKYVKGYGFLSFARNLSNKWRKQFLDTTTKAGLDALKTVSKNVVHEVAEGTGEFIGNYFVTKKWIEINDLYSGGRYSVTRI